jgi:hypothetical protein
MAEIVGSYSYSEENVGKNSCCENLKAEHVKSMGM